MTISIEFIIQFLKEGANNVTNQIAIVISIIVASF